MSEFATGVQESRGASRVRAPGWANITYADTVFKSDRLYDISRAGLSLFLDIQLPLPQEYQLWLSVYRHDKVHTLDVRARCVYSTLVGVSGFRHGFHFSSMNENDQDILAQMIA
jgi:hypothetical protein